MPTKNGGKGDSAWVASVTMGYGHLRAAYPLLDFSKKHFIYADDYDGMPRRDRQLWRESRMFYEMISRFRVVPVIGKPVFDIYDRLQSLPSFYPKRDLSRANLQVREVYALFRSGFMRHFVNRISAEPLPLVTSFFYVAQAADYYGFPNDIYCIVCDTDISRSWVALNPRRSKIKYFAPNRRVFERLKQYGVPEDKIFLTGFPLPKPLIGGLNYSVLKKNLGRRLMHLDPKNLYSIRFGTAIKDLLGRENYPVKSHRTLTLAFAVGGAGAQREMADPILRSLKERIKEEEIRLVLVAGNRPEVASYFDRAIYRNGLSGYRRGVSVLLGKDKTDYFDKFEETLSEVDILWTKPSELSFYAALGIPIIIAPTIGSQEDFNSWWLRNIGAGIPQMDPEYTDEWLFDWLNSGWLARAAVAGFTSAPKRGVYRIEEIVEKGTPVLPEPIEPV